MPFKFGPSGQINNIPALVQIMAWCWPGDKPLSEQMMVIYWCIYALQSLSELKGHTMFLPYWPKFKVLNSFEHNMITA